MSCAKDFAYASAIVVSAYGKFFIAVLCSKEEIRAFQYLVVSSTNSGLEALSKRVSSRRIKGVAKPFARVSSFLYSSTIVPQSFV